MSPLSNATTLANYASGIGTQGATLEVQTANKRVGIGTTNPQGPEGSLQVGTAVTISGNSGIVSATTFHGDFGSSTSVAGNLTVSGVLTYEDVTNIDSVGIITARNAVVISEDNAIHFRGTAADDADAILRASAGGGQLLINSRNDTIINIDSNNDSTDAHFSIAHGGATGSSTELFRVQEDGKMGLGTASPQRLEHLSTSTDTQLRIESTSASGNNEAAIEFIRGSNQSAIKNKAGGLEFFTNTLTTEQMRIDKSGRLLIGTSGSNDIFQESQLQIEGNTSAKASLSLHQNQTAVDGPQLIFGKSRGSGSVGASDILGDIVFAGNDGTDVNSRGAIIRAKIDGTPGSNDLPTHLAFMTTADGASSPTERLRIDSSGRLLLGLSSTLGNQSDADLVVSGDTQGEIYLSRGSTPGNSGSGLGFINFTGGNGVDAAYIRSYSDGGTWTNSSSHPSSLWFGTTADGESTPTVRMKIDSAGRMGLGTQSPVTQLDVEGGTNLGGYIYATGTANVNSGILGRFGFYNKASQAASNPLRAYVTSTRENSNWGADLQFFTSTGTGAATTKVTITEAGYFGLGTTTPAALFEMHGDTPAITLRDTSDYVAGTGPQINFQGKDSNGLNKNLASIHGISHASNDGQLIFKTRTGGTTYERVRIDEQGRVGINNQSPAYLLDVQYQTDRMFQLRYARPYARYNDNAMIDALTLENTGTTASGHGSKIKFIVGTGVSSNTSSISAERDGTAGNTNLVFGTNSTTRMRISSSGEILTSGRIRVSGNYPPSTNLGNGNAQYSCYTAYGATILGQGSSYDISFLNKSGNFAGYVSTNSTTITTSSDERLKENFAPITGALDIVGAMRHETGNYKSDPDRTVSFLVAQDVDQHWPCAVDKSNPEMWGVNYNWIIPLHGAAISELKALIEAQATQIETLEAKVAALEAG